MAINRDLSGESFTAVGLFESRVPSASPTIVTEMTIHSKTKDDAQIQHKSSNVFSFCFLVPRALILT